MPKRKDDVVQKQDNDLEALPIPIQSFLWRQLSPFVRPYNRKIQEASCVTFERVVVQNILHGLSPSLSDAILSIPRWRLIVATLPYVLHCCASSLDMRRHNLHEPLGPNSTKLLYTLHWLLLDAAGECADQERERLKSASITKHPGTPNEPYLFPVTSLQVFVYLFAPILPNLRPSDFTSFRLENGLKIWQPLWEYRQPDIPCFTAPAKPTRSSDPIQPEEMQTTGATGDIYVGTQRDEGFFFGEPERNPEEDAAAKEAMHHATSRHLHAPLVHMSEICTLTTMETPVTPQLELICEICNSKIIPAEKDLMRCKCGHRRRRPQPLPILAQLPLPPANPPSPVDKEFLQNKLDMAIISEGPATRQREISAATYFDVAVMRCLYVPPWTEEGMFWALRYFVHRLVEIRDYFQRTSGVRNRSNSVPSLVSNTTKSRNQSPKHEARSVSPTGRYLLKADLLSPLEAKGSTKRRRMPLATSSEDSGTRFFIGGQPINHAQSKDDAAGSPSFHKLHDVMFSFGVDDGKQSGSPTSLKAGFFSSSNPVTPRERSVRKAGKNFPKITITTENSPTRASVIEEDMVAERGSDIAGRLHELESRSLPRSKTDSNIAYPLSEYQEARGASNLIHDDGELNYQALVRAILVALNERPSQRICDVALSLLDVLLDLMLDVKTHPSANLEDQDLVCNPLHSHTYNRGATPLTPSTSTPLSTPSPPIFHDVLTHRLLMTCITRIFAIVGCAYGCGKESSSSRSNPTDYMRRQAHLLFHRLQTINEPEAKKFLKNMFTQQELMQIVDFGHAFFGSCLSPAAHDPSRSFKQSRKSLSWVAVQISKPLIAQLMNKMEEIKRPENLGLQNDLRALLTYIKEAHDHVFRRIVMSGVMDSQQRQTSIKSHPETPTPIHQHSLTSKRKPLNRHSTEEVVSAENTDVENLSSFEESAPSANYLRGLFAKKPKVLLKPLRSRESSETNLKMNSLKSPRVSISEDESVHAGSPRAQKKKHGFAFRQRWLKSPKSSMGSRGESRRGTLERGTLERSTSLVSGEGSSETSRQQSLESSGQSNTKPRLSFKATGHMSLGVLRTRRLVDHNSNDEDLPARSMQKRASGSRREDSSFSGRVDFILNTGALTSGMRCLGSLLEFCPPGTVPEAAVLAAMLDLQAPVLARAAFFLECAQFVHRCNQGKWPEWMKLNTPQYRQSGPIGRLVAPTPRKQNILQRTAGKVFYEWARSLSLRLDEVMKGENVDPVALVSPTLCSVEEDFFVLGNDNLEPGNCPFVLKIAACQLLLEVTTFLRETYRQLPRREKYGTLRGYGRSIAGAGDKRPAHRRMSSVISTSGGTSHQSIQSFVEHGQVHMIQGGHGPGERRISFMIADDNFSQKSGSSGGLEEERRSHLLKSGRDRAKQHQIEGPQGRRRSVRIRKSSQGDNRQRADSIRSRKASSVSGRSDASQSSAEEQTTPHTDDTRDVFALEENTEYSDNMPWLETMITLCSRFSFICDHKKACTLYCFYRLMQSCKRLCWAMDKIHQDSLTGGIHGSSAKTIDDEETEESQAQSGSQTPTTPSSHRKLKILRKASQYAGLNRLSKTTATLEKNESMDSVNKIRHGSADGRDLISCKTDEISYYPQSNESNNPMSKYLKQHVLSLFVAPFSALAKGLLVMDEEQMERLFPICWELLLVDDEEVASVTAVLCIVYSVKISKFVIDFIRKEMCHEEAEQRVDSILKFQALWRYRYQVWIRLEDGAQGLMRISTALNIDYTLPSPLIGRSSLDCPDAPWLPPTSIKIEEVAISQEEQSKNSNTLVAATQTRRKQLQESMSKALRAQEERNQREREKTRITMLPVLKLAAIEPIPQQIIDDREEVDEGGVSAETGTVATHTLVFPPVFPTSLATATLQLIDLLDDADVDNCGISVGDLAFHTLLEGIVEDAGLFMRYILEKVSNKDKQNLILRKIRKLLSYMPRLPQQAAGILFNHLLGYCMSFVRSSNENNFNGVEAVMSVMWHVIPSVEGISFKDIKAVMRREQCDAYLLLTANVPGAKKLTINPFDPTNTTFNSPFPTTEEETENGEKLTRDKLFRDMLIDCCVEFNIPENERQGYWLTDAKTGRIHNPSQLVKDVYFFRRTMLSEMNMVRIPTSEAMKKLQEQAYHSLFLETQKVLMVVSLFQSAAAKSESAMQQQQAMLLEDGLTKIPNFPRKALECEVKFQDGPRGTEYIGIDVMHKYGWVQMTSSLLTSLSRNGSELQLSYADIHMLLGVLNGVLVLHCQDLAILRLSLATFINVARNIKTLFSATGFLIVMPTLLTIYASHQSNLMITNAIEFACSQFFILHRNPFLLQLFGSAADLLELSQNELEKKPLKRSHIKRILFSLEKYGRRQSKVVAPQSRPLSLHSYHPLDALDILEQVDGKKPLASLDFCYQNDVYDFSPATILTSAVSSCIAVIAFDAAESPRGTQMLQVLRTLLNEEVWYDEKAADSAKSAKDELHKLISLSGVIKSLVFSCESLTRPFPVPPVGIVAASRLLNVNPDSQTRPQVSSFSPSHAQRDNDIEANRPKITVQEPPEESEKHSEFSSPRNHLLAIVAHFLTTANTRIRYLSKFLGDLATRPPELIDVKSHVRLAEIAQALLKVAPHTKEVMACEGLQLYMIEILPNIDFSIENLKPTLQTLLKRIDKTFIKLMRPNLRKDVSLPAAAKIIQGLTKTLCNNNLMALMPQLRSTTGSCIHLTLGEQVSTSPESGPTSPTLLSTTTINQPVSAVVIPSIFRNATIDLCSVYLQAGKEYCNLEQLCAQFSDKFLRLVVSFLLPFVLRVGSGAADLPPMRIEDLRYIVRALVLLLHPPITKQPAGPKQLSVSANVNNITRTNSNMSNPPSSGPIPHATTFSKHQDISRRVAFLGLKVVVACYEERLGSEWLRLAKSIQDYGEKGSGGLAFWEFLEYTVTYRTTLFVHLAPFVARIFELPRKEGDAEQHVQLAIRRALVGDVAGERSRECIFAKIAMEMNGLMEEYAVLTLPPSRSPTQVGNEEGSQAESDGVHKLPDFSRFRYGKQRKESVQADYSSSTSAGGKRSPPIVIPVVIERSEANSVGVIGGEGHHGGHGKTNALPQFDRKRSALVRQRAQYGEKDMHGHTVGHSFKKALSADVPESVEMLQISKPGTNEENLGNNVHTKIVTVSVVHNKKPVREKQIHVRRESVDSLNDDEQISLLK